MSLANKKHAANRPRVSVSRLSDAQLLTLMSYLHAPERPRSTMPVDAAHGAICAVACAPFAVSPAKWLPAILGEGHAFPSVEKEREITGLLMRLHESTLHELERGPRLAIVANDSSGTAVLREWAEGYLIGVALSDPPWHELVRAEEDFACLMFPFFVLAERQDEIDARVGPSPNERAGKIAVVAGDRRLSRHAPRLDLRLLGAIKAIGVVGAERRTIPGPRTGININRLIQAVAALSLGACIAPVLAQPRATAVKALASS